MGKKTNLVVRTLLIMTMIELSVFMLIDQTSQNAKIWHYYAIFINIMIAGGVVFKNLAIWEENKGYYVVNYGSKIPTKITVTGSMLTVSWVIVTLFFICFALSFTNIFNVVNPEFKSLLHYPALFSGIVQAVLTFVGMIMRST